MEFRNLVEQLRRNGERALVVGMGISGIETALFFRRCEIAVTLVEREAEEKFKAKSKFAARLGELEAAKVDVQFGIDGEAVGAHLTGVKLCVLSPGVSLESAVCGTLRRHGVPFVSELELAVEVLGWPSVIVTGSNGKSTTVCLVDHMLRCSGIPSYLCGNVGTPVIAAAGPEHLKTGQKSQGVLVVEASSYQLESCSVLKPKVGVLLNLSDNHLERHGSMQRYFDAKTRLFQRQDSSDFAVLNADDGWGKNLVRSSSAQTACFGSAASVKQFAWRASPDVDSARSQSIEVAIAGKVETYDLRRCKLLGQHNRLNICASALAARLAGASQTGVQDAINTFFPLEHRLEPITEIAGVLYINDSKSTTVAASVAALSTVLEAFPQRPVNLMIGGLSKAGSWQPLLHLIEKHRASLRPVVCFGQDAGILANHCRAQGIAHVSAESLKAGLSVASRQAVLNDIVLLSPGCASFDEFSDFEHRGVVFKELVLRPESSFTSQ